MKLLILYTCLLFLSACSTHIPTQIDSAPSAPPKNLSNIPDAVPKYEPKSRGGNPVSYQVFGKTYFVKPNSLGYKEQGTASWYGTKFHGRKTSNGETYDMYAMTAAHKSLPIPTYLKVKNIANNKEIIVRVNDRGPFHGNRIVDLSYAAAAKLDMLGKGTAVVQLEAINTRGQSTKINSNLPSPKTFKATNISSIKPLPLKKIKNINARTKTVSPAPPSEPTTKIANIYLQAGAFKDQKNAQNLTLNLQQKGIPLNQVNVRQINGSAIYRVHIGPYSSLAQAESMRAKLLKAGIKSPHYTQY
jgi:rare lipoprotein A